MFFPHSPPTPRGRELGATGEGGDDRQVEGALGRREKVSLVQAQRDSSALRADASFTGGDTWETPFL